MPVIYHLLYSGRNIRQAKAVAESLAVNGKATAESVAVSKLAPAAAETLAAATGGGTAEVKQVSYDTKGVKVVFANGSEVTKPYTVKGALAPLYLSHMNCDPLPVSLF